ncbi:MAG: methyltransferase domain-containing protein [Terracidiphilus sp.]|nr:methyltransferase domain-containing protein [Terracidiphilus sp.]
MPSNPLMRLLPATFRAWLRGRKRTIERGLLAFDRVTDFGVLRRTTPYRPELGGRRGSYIDRYYIEQFLAAHRDAIHGAVAEIQGDEYTRRFGAERVTRSEVIDINPANENRTLTLDLTATAAAPEAEFDCILCTQTLLLIRDYKAAICTLHKMLKPGGTVLVTVPGISPVIRGGLIAGEGEDCWRFTTRSARQDFAQVFGEPQVEARSYGNVLTATAFLHGLVQEELTSEELAFHDPDYELIVVVAATRASGNQD